MQRAGLETLVLTHQAEVHRYMRYLGLDAATAEDLAQDVFVIIFERGLPPSITSATEEAAWLRGIARNLFLQWCRKRGRERTTGSDPNALDGAERVWSGEFLRDGDGFDYLEALRQCRDRLNERQLKALDYRYGKGLSHREMSTAFGISAPGVKMLLRRVRAVLAKCIGKRLGLEHGA
jgi:RNA polymerase sigma-70 factor (ECF subfamily)